MGLEPAHEQGEATAREVQAFASPGPVARHEQHVVDPRRHEPHALRVRAVEPHELRGFSGRWREHALGFRDHRRFGRQALR